MKLYLVTFNIPPIFDDSPLATVRRKKLVQARNKAGAKLLIGGLYFGDSFTDIRCNEIGLAKDTIRERVII